MKTITINSIRLKVPADYDITDIKSMILTRESMLCGNYEINIAGHIYDFKKGGNTK